MSSTNQRSDAENKLNVQATESNKAATNKQEGANPRLAMGSRVSASGWGDEEDYDSEEGDESFGLSAGNNQHGNAGRGNPSKSKKAAQSGETRKKSPESNQHPGSKSDPRVEENKDNSNARQDSSSKSTGEAPEQKLHAYGGGSGGPDRRRQRQGYSDRGDRRGGRGRAQGQQYRDKRNYQDDRHDDQDHPKDSRETSDRYQEASGNDSAAKEDEARPNEQEKQEDKQQDKNASNAENAIKQTHQRPIDDEEVQVIHVSYKSDQKSEESSKKHQNDGGDISRNDKNRDNQDRNDRRDNRQERNRGDGKHNAQNKNNRDRYNQNNDGDDQEGGHQNNRDSRDNRGGDRGDRDRGGRHQKDYHGANAASNFRQYYQNDSQFYETVMKKEDPPFEFKINLFTDYKNKGKNHTDEGDDQRDDAENRSQLSHREINLQVMNKLQEFDAVNIKDIPIQQGGRLEKIRYMFEIKGKDQALACYRFFDAHNKRLRQRGDKKDAEVSQVQAESSFTLREPMKIYLQMEEPVFERYADEEAAIYEEMQRIEQDQRDKDHQAPKQGRGGQGGQNGGHQRKRDDRDQERNHRDRDRTEREVREKGGVTIEEAEKLGVHFSKGPPRFKNQKKQEKRDVGDEPEHDQQAQHQDNARDDRGAGRGRGGPNLRAIIEAEKHKSAERRKKGDRDLSDRLEAEYGRETNGESDHDPANEQKNWKDGRDEQARQQAGRGRGRGQRRGGRGGRGRGDFDRNADGQEGGRGGKNPQYRDRDPKRFEDNRRREEGHGGQSQTEEDEFQVTRPGDDAESAGNRDNKSETNANNGSYKMRRGGDRVRGGRGGGRRTDQRHSENVYKNRQNQGNDHGGENRQIIDANDEEEEKQSAHGQSEKAYRPRDDESDLGQSQRGGRQYRRKNNSYRGGGEGLRGSVVDSEQRQYRNKEFRERGDNRGENRGGENRGGNGNRQQNQERQYKQKGHQEDGGYNDHQYAEKKQGDNYQRRDNKNTNDNNRNENRGGDRGKPSGDNKNRRGGHQGGQGGMKKPNMPHEFKKQQDKLKAAQNDLKMKKTISTSNRFVGMDDSD